MNHFINLTAIYTGKGYKYQYNREHEQTNTKNVKHEHGQNTPHYVAVNTTEA